MNRFLVRGASVLDVSNGERRQEDLAVVDGRVVDPSGHNDLDQVDGGGLTMCFGLWDCHAHPGGLMYDPLATGYFEGVADRTVRAGANLVQALHMGVTGVRALGEGSGIDLAWARAAAGGIATGPRLKTAGQALGTTGGHGTAYPRRYVEVEDRLVADGQTQMQRAVRLLAERGVDWVKMVLTGGLFSEHEAVDGGQFTVEEFEAVMATARQRALPVAAHCGSPRWAERFARAGGRSVEHGYALDEAAAAAMAASGTWLVPTIGVTHDTELMAATGWPVHAVTRAKETAPIHEQALRTCLDAGVLIATGADLNPIGPQLHAELALLHSLGMTRLQVLEAATVGGRRLNRLGDEPVPQPGSAADLLLLDGDPLEDLGVLARPTGVVVFGRMVVRPGGTTAGAALPAG